MIQSLLILTNTIILLFLSLLHFYWAFGGSWGIDSAIPDKFRSNFFNEKNKFQNTIATLFVAAGLTFFAIILASNYFNLTPIIKSNWTSIGTKIIGGLFLLRVIGDFNIVGIFKKNATGKFAKSDTKIFVPICLFIGISCFLISFLF